MERPKPSEARLRSKDPRHATSAEADLQIELHEEATEAGSADVQDKALQLLARLLVKAASRCPR